MEIHQKLSLPNHQKLMTMVRRSLNQKLRFFDVRHGKFVTGAVVKNRKGLIAVEGGKGQCCQWKEKDQCSKGDQCSFRHESNDREQKPIPKAATPSEPSPTRGRRMSRKRSIRGKSNPSMILRQPCKCFLEGNCTRSPCEYWHPPECHFHKLNRDVKQGMNVYSRIVRLANNQKTEKSYHSQKRKRQRRQKCCSYCENCTTIGFVSRKTRSHWILREAYSPGETRCKKSWDQINEYDSQKLRSAAHTSEKSKDPRLERYK